MKVKKFQMPEGVKKISAALKVRPRRSKIFQMSQKPAREGQKFFGCLKNLPEGVKKISAALKVHPRRSEKFQMSQKPAREGQKNLSCPKNPSKKVKEGQRG